MGRRRDGLLSEDEFEGGLHGYYDEDQDGLLDENEFANYEEEERGFWDI